MITSWGISLQNKGVAFNPFYRDRISRTNKVYALPEDKAHGRRKHLQPKASGSQQHGKSEAHITATRGLARES